MKAVDEIPVATHFGTLIFGERSIDCAVLEDGRRILSLRGLAGVLGRLNRKASDGGAQWPPYLQQKRLNPYLGELLAVVHNSPFEVIIPQAIDGRHVRDNRAIAIDAELLPAILWAYVEADGDGVLRGDQKQHAKRARQILKALSGVAIVALVDEATGYQRERQENELQALLLEQLVKPERQEWAKRYSDEFFELLYRTYEIHADPKSHHRPGIVGNLINFLVYDRIAPGLTAELQRLNGDRAARHHQYLTERGLNDLQLHLEMLKRLMTLSRDRCEFEDKLALVLPRGTEQMRLRFFRVLEGERNGASHGL